MRTTGLLLYLRRSLPQGAQDLPDELDVWILVPLPLQDGASALDARVGADAAGAVLHAEVAGVDVLLLGGYAGMDPRGEEFTVQVYNWHGVSLRPIESPVWILTP